MTGAWDRWSHPDWSGETVFILGGGPSLRGFDAERLRGRRVIAINEAGLSLCPWADILFWSDVRWVDWNMGRLDMFRGTYRYTCQKHRIAEIPKARHVTFRPRDDRGNWNPFETDPRAVAGHDSGSKAINLACHLGTARVVLLGFDMHDLTSDRWKEGSFHDWHEAPPLDGQRARFRDAHTRMAAALPEGVTVVNATPNSALTCWPAVNLEDEL